MSPCNYSHHVHLTSCSFLSRFLFKGGPQLPLGLQATSWLYAQAMLLNNDRGGPEVIIEQHVPKNDLAEV